VTNILSLPSISFDVSSSQKGDLYVPIAFQNSSNAPIDLTGITFTMLLHPMLATTGGADTLTVLLTGSTAGSFLTNSGTSGTLTIDVPLATISRFSPGTYFIDLLASGDGFNFIIGEATITQVASGPCIVTSFTSTPRSPESAVASAASSDASVSATSAAESATSAAESATSAAESATSAAESATSAAESAASIANNTGAKSINGLTGAVTIAANNLNTVSVSGSTITISGPGGLDNPFHNAGCNVAQRGTGPISVPTTNAYTLDGWLVAPSGAAVSASQAAGIGSSLHSLQVTGASGNTDVQIVRRVESFIAAPFAGQTAILQFKTKNNSGASITPSVSFSSPATADNFSSKLTSAGTTTATQACANGATTLCSIAVAISAAATNGLQIAIDLGALTSASDTVQISEIDLSLAPNAAPGLVNFPPPVRLARIDEDLRFCERCLSLTGNGAAGSASASTIGFGIRFPQPMRATPTLSLTTTTLSANQPGVANPTATDAAIASSLGLSATGAEVQISGFSGASAGAIFLETDAILASAEL
jgi:trimeric autotransporter adhesin